jgi:hypothetical protein
MKIERQTSDKGKQHNSIELDLKASGHPSNGASFSFSSSDAPGFYDSEQDKKYDYTTTVSLYDVFQILLAIQKRLESIPRNEMDRDSSIHCYGSEKVEQELLDQFAETKMPTLLLKIVHSYIEAVNKTRTFPGKIREEDSRPFDFLLNVDWSDSEEDLKI